MRYHTNFTLLHAVIQLLWLKRFFPQLNYLGTIDEKQLTINTWVF